MGRPADEGRPGTATGPSGPRDDAGQVAGNAEEVAVPKYDWATGPIRDVADGLTGGDQPPPDSRDTRRADPGPAGDRLPPAAP